MRWLESIITQEGEKEVTAMAMSYNTELTATLVRGSEVLAELPGNISRGVEACVEVANNSGSNKLIASSMALEEAAENVKASGKEFLELVEQLIKGYKQVEAALD